MVDPQRANDSENGEGQFLAQTLRALENLLTPEELAAWNAQLAADPEKRRWFVRLAFQSRALAELTRATDPGATLPPPREHAANRSPGRSRMKFPWHGRRRLLIGLATAASVFVAAGLLVSRFSLRTEITELEPSDPLRLPAGAVAVILEGPHAVWQPDMALPTAPGVPLGPGVLKLQAGIVQIRFQSDATVTLEGPAEFRLDSENGGTLRRGKLTAMVPEEARGFTVRTPQGRVVDLGTEFGLRVDDAGGTDVCVFEGLVEALRAGAGAAGAVPMRVTEGKAAHMDAQGPDIRLAAVDAAVFAPLRATPAVPVVDAYVRGGKYRHDNFGAASRLAVKKGSPDFTREVFLRFDLAKVQGTLAEAHLRLVPVRVHRVNGEHALALVADHRWEEKHITWEDRPGSGGALAAWKPEKGKPVDIDVTAAARQALQGDRLLSVRVFATLDTGPNGLVEYGAREGPPQARPQLLLKLDP